jgi:hypothetical protein
MFTFEEQNGIFILLGLYVDDLVIISPNLAYLEQSKAKLANESIMTNSDDLSYCLDIQMMQNPF